jgi:cytidine deaminase
MSSKDPIKDQRPELIFALVGGVGTGLDDLSQALKEELSTFGYKSVDIKLSSLLNHVKGCSIVQTEPDYCEYLCHYQKMGKLFRKQISNGGALALASIIEIRAERAKILKSVNEPTQGVAYILNQLKHPDEVDLLRNVYGPSFLAIAAHAPRENRVNDLANKMTRKASQPGQTHKFIGKAADIIDIDDKEDDEFGQNVRDTYPKADYFANLMSLNMKRDVQRFVHLLFGHPFHTPYPEEYAMYHANAVSLRSSDDNRQVGAIIFDIDNPLTLRDLRQADVIAVGTNEVPHGGGGLYWEQDASPDPRDQALLRKGENRADEIKVSALAELIEKIKIQKWFNEKISATSAIELAKDLLPNLKGTQFRDIGEFSRPVHAEMAALIDAARRGVAVDGHSMYVTTFPCHNCAKHIIAAGIQRVVYLEPYQKSRAGNLYAEEIVLEAVPGKEERNKVNFIAYSGVAPRQYQQLFSMSKRGAKRGKALNTWDTEKRSLVPICVPQNASLLYIAAEHQALESLPPDIYTRS